MDTFSLDYYRDEAYFQTTSFYYLSPNDLFHYIIYIQGQNNLNIKHSYMVFDEFNNFVLTIY